MTATKEEPKVLENLSEEEACLFAILSDPSGIDQAEFLWTDHSSEDNKFCPKCGCQRDGVHLFEHEEIDFKEWDTKYPAPSVCFRAWAFQWPWWRDHSPLAIDQCGRSLGKSMSIKVRACAFPFLFPGQEMVITAPELVHLEPIVSLIESQLFATRVLSEMVIHGKGGVTHRPFQCNFVNGCRIIGRIPQRDGKGVKGLHPIWLEMDECIRKGTYILTARGQIPIEDVQVGDEVWTHQGRWRLVTATFDRGERETVKVRGQGHPGLYCTLEHPFWARPIEKWTIPSRREGPIPGDPCWIEACHLRETYWASPKLPAGVALPPPLIEGTRRGPGANSIVWRQPDFLWMLGLFAAEGSLSSSYGKGGKLNRCYWSIHTNEVDEVCLRAKRAGLTVSVEPVQNSENAKNLLVTHQGLAAFLNEHIGRNSHHVSLPSWVYSLTDEERHEVLSGAVYGDGFDDPDERYCAGRWKLTTVSKALAVSVRLLAQGLGNYVSVYDAGPRKTPSAIRGKIIKPSDHTYQVVGNQAGQGKDDDLHRWTRIRKVSLGGVHHLYDLEVADDHSFVAEGVVVHNSQDYPHAGWVELRETLKRGFAGATWRAHGVTRGVRDDFYESTQDSPDNPWRIFRFSAMWRPNWTDQERKEALEKYGSREDPDYRRNILGLHGDRSNPIFVLTALMKNTDSDPLSDYNQNEYFKVSTKIEQLETFDQTIADVLDFPIGHLRYAGSNDLERRTNPKALYWIGMDVGFTIDPSEILVFVEYREKPKDEYTRIKLLTRISMARMPHREQLWAMLHTIDFYRPKAFAMDKTGLGLPLFQELQEHMDSFRAERWDEIPPWMRQYDLDLAIRTVKGYNFSEKLVVDFDKSIEVSQFEDPVAKAGMRRNAVEYATDVLRELVDRTQLWLPWDDELLKQFQGGTWTSSRSMDAYGRRSFSKGNDHCLDASRMMALGWAQYAIEEMLSNHVAEPVFDSVIEF